jgi:ATP-dependent Clp protease ATP-binding subunit ClpB
MDKLTLKAQDAVYSAQSIATANNHAEIQPEHLLKALIDQDGGIFATIARKIGVSPAYFKSEVDA